MMPFEKRIQKDCWIASSNLFLYSENSERTNMRTPHYCFFCKLFAILPEKEAFYLLSNRFFNAKG